MIVMCLFFIERGSPKEVVKNVVEILNKQEAIKVSKLIYRSLPSEPEANITNFNNNFLLSILCDLHSWQIFEF